jgi:hypothetical protein
MRAARTLPALALVALVACQEPDVGQRCDIGLDPVTYNPTSIPSEIFQTFNPVCDNLVCLMSPLAAGEPYASCAGDGSLCGYCSKPCVSDQDCFESETGLECRQIVLDEEFINSLPPEVRETYLAGVTFSSYCAVPQG